MMTRYSFRKGECLRLDGITYRISQVSGRNVELTSFGDGSLAVRNVDDLLSQYANGRLIFVDATKLDGQQMQAEQRATVDRGLADFPESIQRLALRKFKF